MRAQDVFCFHESNFCAACVAAQYINIDIGKPKLVELPLNGPVVTDLLNNVCVINLFAVKAFCKFPQRVKLLL